MVKEKLVTRNMKVSELKVTTIATTPDGCKMDRIFLGNEVRGKDER